MTFSYDPPEQTIVDQPEDTAGQPERAAFAERRDRVAGLIYEYWNSGRSWAQEPPEGRIAYEADADIAIRAADIVDRTRYASPTAADIYREVAARLDLYIELERVRQAGVTALPDAVRRWAEELPAETGHAAAVRDYVQALLRQYRADEDARLEAIRALEVSGRRIVEGGQSGQDQWEVRDWRSGETLVAGSGGIDAYDATCARLDPDGSWLHVENVPFDQTDAEPVGIPGSLADALQDWLGSTGTPDDDVAEFVGWSVDEVARHRAER